MSSDPAFQRSLRRLKPEKYDKPLMVRDRSELTFLDQLQRPFPKLLLDTTVYIDELQGTLPREVEISLRLTAIRHSTVTESELTALASLLDPNHPNTRRSMNDALLFLSAAKHGCSVLTRNISDFDLLMQLAPYGKSIFYSRMPVSSRSEPEHA